MAAGLFGALGAIGDTGNQVAEGRQIAHEEIVRRLAEQQAQQAATLNQQRIKQQIEQGNQNMQIARQPLAVGTAYVSGGKTYQRTQDPLTGAFSVKELPGGLPETPEQEMFRGLMNIPGMTEESASSAVVKKLTGKTTQKREVVPDANSPTGFSAIYLDSSDGAELWRTAVLPPRQAGETATTRTSTDQYGNKTTSVTDRRPVFPGFPGAGGGVPMTGATGRYGAPPPALGAVRGAVGLPPAPGAQGGQPAPQGTPKAASIPAPKGGTTAGPYKGLDAQGNIPENAPVNPQVREFANNLMQGGDANKIPVKARALAESVARKYGWRGQGALTPQQQMQIEQVDSQLSTMDQDKYMKLFDSTKTRLHLAMLPLDPSTEGGLSAMKDSQLRSTLSEDEFAYLDDLTRLRGVITGIRGFAGGNSSNATADRLLAELPNFSNTTNAKDARYKISRLRGELAIIKRLGFLQPTGPNTAAPGADNPLNLNLPAVQ